jgi:hypothetical protein
MYQMCIYANTFAYIRIIRCGDQQNPNSMCFHSMFLTAAAFAAAMALATTTPSAATMFAAAATTFAAVFLVGT